MVSFASSSLNASTTPRAPVRRESVRLLRLDASLRFGREYQAFPLDRLGKGVQLTEYDLVYLIQLPASLPQPGHPLVGLVRIRLDPVRRVLSLSLIPDYFLPSYC
jgi:hypothetical protein